MHRTATRRTVIAGAVWAMTAVLLCSCKTQDNVPLPAPPWPESSETPYGDLMMAAMGRLAAQLQTRIDAGKPTSERYYLVPDEKSVTALRDWYDPKAAALGYVKVADLDGGRLHRDAAFGYRKGGEALVVGWIKQRPPGRVPVIVMHFGRADGQS